MFWLLLPALFLCWWILSVRHPKKFPPGPRFPLPFAGDVLSLKGNIVTGAERLQKIHGDVVGMWLGPIRTVFIHDYDMAVELFNGDACDDRIGFETQLRDRGGGPDGRFGGVLFASGSNWKEQRRYALHMLRDLGYGKENMDKAIIDQVEILARKLEANHLETPFFIDGLFNISVLNSLWVVATGEHVDIENTKMKKIVSLISEAAKATGEAPRLLAGSYPKFATFLEQLKFYRFTYIWKFISGSIEEIIGQIEKGEGNNNENFVEKYIEKMSTSKEGSSFYGKVGRENLKHILLDFLVAGSETSSNTLMWIMLFLMKYPHIQERLVKELSKSFGSFHPSYHQRTECAYVDAFIHEAQRVANMFCLALPHGTTRDVAIVNKKTGEDFFLPKGTRVFSSITTMLKDEREFPKPEVFNPERFITKEGVFKPSPKVPVFGIGRRKCLGETLARMTLFHFTVGMVRRFKVEAAPGDPLDVKRIDGITTAPSPFKLVLRTR